MKLSVIVPVYNTQAYLRDCIHSILEQSRQDFELILINDGSTDDSQQIINEYTSRYPGRVRSLTVENGGQGRARNFGIELAQGEYLSFIDSDDTLHPETFAHMLDAAEKEEADIVVCDMEKRFDDGRREYVKAALQENPLAAAGSASNKIFRRSRVGEIRFPTGLWYEDFAFSAKLLLLSQKTVFIHQPLYIYRCGQSSTMNNNNARKNLDILTIMQNIRDFACEHGYQDGFEFFLINHVLLDTIKRVQRQKDPEKKAVIREIRAYVKKSIPNLSRCKSFQAESRNRRIIMWLNYHGLETVSALVLSVHAKRQKTS